MAPPETVTDVQAFLNEVVLMIEFGNGANTVSGSTASNTELSKFFGAHRVPGRDSENPQ